MWVIPVIAVLIIAAVVLNRFLTRDTTHPLERHERALAALRELSEKPRPVVRDLAPPPALPSEHIRILGDGPDDVPKRRQRSRRSAASARSRRAGARTVQPDPVELPVIPIGDADEDEPALPPTPAPKAPAPAAQPAAAVAAAEVPELPVPPPSSWAEPNRPWMSRRALTSAGVGVAVAATFVGAFLITTENGHGSGNHASPPVQVPAAPRTTAAPSTTTPTTAALPGVQLVNLPTGDASVSVRGPFTLSLQATGRCWVQVTGATGQTLFEGTLLQGEVQTVSGTPPLTVRLGNTRGIALRVDGSNLDLAGVANTANVRFQTG